MALEKFESFWSKKDPSNIQIILFQQNILPSGSATAKLSGFPAAALCSDFLLQSQMST